MNDKPISGTVLDEEAELTLSDLCRVCGSHAEWVIELVDEGILTPTSETGTQLRFSGASLTIVSTAMRLKTDLGLNLAGVALALDLMVEIDLLRARLSDLDDGF